RWAVWARVCAAEVAPNGISQPAEPAPDGGLILPALMSSEYVDSHSVRKHSTCRASPLETASMAAITEPPGPKVSMPPLYQVGRMPRADWRTLTPPSPKPPTLPPPGYDARPSMSSM